MQKKDILVVGGGPAGVIAAVTARKNERSKTIALVRDKEKEVIPCGIPYIFNRLEAVDEDILPDKPLESNNIELIIDRAVKIDKDDKTVELESEQKIGYDKLILATGSHPTHVPIAGIDKKGVWQVKKDFKYLQQLRQQVLAAEDLVIIGGGFIGVELAEELSEMRGINIKIIEKLNHCLGQSFDQEFADLAEERLRKDGVEIYTGATVKEVKGEGKVEAVELDSGEKLAADLVILSIGAKPDTKLAESAEIKTGEYGAISTDEYMRTNVPDIFAVGDCAETRDFFTGEYIPVMLASTATNEARIAATNLYQLEDLRENEGTLSAFATSIKGLVLGETGITETRAKEEGFDVVIGKAECPNHHPASLPKTETIKVKLIFSQTSKALLGAQVAGPESVSEMTNILALAIREELTVYDFNTLQISTHPLLTAAPTVYPLINAAQSVLEKVG